MIKYSTIQNKLMAYDMTKGTVATVQKIDIEAPLTKLKRVISNKVFHCEDLEKLKQIAEKINEII